MSLKSSLADCCPTGWARSPKTPANAEATRSVAAWSLSVSGNRSNSSNSGSSGQFDAAHTVDVPVSAPLRLTLDRFLREQAAGD